MQILLFSELHLMLHFEFKICLKHKNKVVIRKCYWPVTLCYFEICIVILLLFFVISFYAPRITKNNSCYSYYLLANKQTRSGIPARFFVLIR